MRPHWLRGWSWWADVRPTGDAGDQRPLWQRLAAFVGVKRRF